MKYLTIVLGALLALPSFAQTTLGNTNGLQQDARAEAVVAPGAVQIDNSSNTPGRQRIETTGQAIAPGVYNASGTYNCFGGASAAVGWMGAAIGGGGTVSQAECYRLHLMDKARQANQTVVYAALFCQFPDGKAAYEAAGIECPTKRERDRATAILNDQPAPSTDPYIAARLARQGK